MLPPKPRPWSQEELILLKAQGKNAELPNRSTKAVAAMWYKVGKMEGAEWDDYLQKSAPEELFTRGNPTDYERQRYRGVNYYYNDLPRSGMPWTAEENRLLLDAPDNVTNEGLARQLGRSESAVSIQRKRLKEGGSPLRNKFSEWRSELDVKGATVDDMLKFCRAKGVNFEELCLEMYPSKMPKYTTVEEALTLIHTGKLNPIKFIKKEKT